MRSRRVVLLVATLLPACQPASPARPDVDGLTARLSCTTPPDTSLDHRVWRGTLDLSADPIAVDLALEPMYPDTVADPRATDALGGDFTAARDGDTITVDLGADGALALATDSDLGGGLLVGTLARAGSAAVDLYCWPDGWRAAPRYDGAGACLDGQVEGVAAVPMPVVRETGDGQCADLSGVDLSEGFYGYPDLNLDLRGARLDGAGLHFANLVDAHLEGAEMETLDWGYAHIDGVVDAHTVLPVDCTAASGEVHCVR